MHENELGKIILGAAIEVHRELGPGLLESVYEEILAYELGLLSLSVEKQVPVSIEYKSMHFEKVFRADLIFENKVLLELKSVESISKSHRKQIQTYLSLTGLKLGYLLNFGAPTLKQGIVRAVNGLQEPT